MNKQKKKTFLVKFTERFNSHFIRQIFENCSIAGELKREKTQQNKVVM